MATAAAEGPAATSAVLYAAAKVGGGARAGAGTAD